MPIDRRQLLLASAFSTLPGLVTTPAWSSTDPGYAADFWRRPRTLRLKHVKGDRIVTTYWSDGEILTSAYQEISWFLRDREDAKAVWMQPVLLDIVYGVCGWLDYFQITEPLLVTSGYRTPGRNRNIEGAARNSQHTKGGAVDIRIPGVSTSQVSSFARWLGGGGVGFYPSKNFTHLDCGRLRYWRG